MLDKEVSSSKTWPWSFHSESESASKRRMNQPMRALQWRSSKGMSGIVMVAGIEFSPASTSGSFWVAMIWRASARVHLAVKPDWIGSYAWRVCAVGWGPSAAEARGAPTAAAVVGAANVPKARAQRPRRMGFRTGFSG